MSYGNLHVFAGPMFSGKTEDITKEVLYRTYFTGEDEEDRISVGVFKPVVDTRFDANCVVSHNGATIAATPIRTASELRDLELSAAFFDEVQFFTSPHFEGDFLDAVRGLRMNGTEVFCAGLDMDYIGRAFEVTSALMAEASHLKRLTATCSVCGAPATHTTRHEFTAERILLGARDTYAPMCARHWFEERCAQARAGQGSWGRTHGEV